MNKPVKKYRLLKDLPDAKAGAVLTFDGNNCYDYKSTRTMDTDSNNLISWYRKEFVENTPEWFEPIPEETKQTGERITVTVVNNGYAGEMISIRPNRSEWKIPKEKNDAIKQAIEATLNNEEVVNVDKWVLRETYKRMLKEKNDEIAILKQLALNDDKAGEEKDYWKKYADLANSEWARKTEQKYTQQQLEQAEKDAFEAGQAIVEFNTGKKGQFKFIVKYPTFQDYKQSLASSPKQKYDSQPISRDTWKETEQSRDWEVESFQGNDTGLMHYRRDDGLFRPNKLTEEHLLSRVGKNAKIYSVKRLSDGIVFTVGDKIDHRESEDCDWNNSPSKIMEFAVRDKTMIVEFMEDDETSPYPIGSVCRELCDVKKLPTPEPNTKTEPLFRTEDGVEMLIGNDYWVIDNNDSEFKIWAGKVMAGNYFSKERKYFSSKEKADEYVLMNKPCLSVNDILSIAYYKTNFRIELPKKELEHLAKQKNKQ